MISVKLLQTAYGLSQSRAAFWAPVLSQLCEMYDVNTNQRVACFLAQIGHESGRLIYTRELWGPTASQLRYERDFSAPWPSSPAEAKHPAFSKNRLAYTLGNSKPGDGKRFMGRGLIQCTGRFNYTQMTARLLDRFDGQTPDFSKAPALMEEPVWAALVTGEFWLSRSLNGYADKYDFAGLTKRINGGYNGLADRQKLYSRLISLI